MAAETAPPPAVGPQDSPNDVVVVGACRTASTRARKGGFKDATADSLVMAVLRDILRRTGIKPEARGAATGRFQSARAEQRSRGRGHASPAICLRPQPAPWPPALARRR